MKHFSEVTACVVDDGLFPHIARRLASEFQKVYYTPTWETAFPHIRDAVIGDGYPEIQWIESVWDARDADLFVFPDIGHSSLQVELVRQGKAVWGCRHADGLEARRGLFLKELKASGLPVPAFTVKQGITQLRSFLEENEDKFIKVSTYRGDFETFHFRSMSEDSSVLDSWAVLLGPLRELVRFYVFDPIESVAEDGCDTWCIDGVWPQTVLHGMEAKDKALLATFCKFNDLPDPVRLVNERFGPVLAKYGYRSFFSTEVRITEEGEGFFIDPTCRCPSPPSQLQCEMIGNLGEIVWCGANGLVIEPEPVKQFGVQAIFQVPRGDWFVLKIPHELQQWVKVGFSCMVDGNICVPPDQSGVAEIGWVLGIGDSIEEAIDHLKENVEQMPSGVEVQVGAIGELLEQAREVEFTDEKVPEPEIAVVD